MSRGLPLWLTLFAVACSSETTAPDQQLVELAAVLPADGASGVDPRAPITLEFKQPMMTGMEQHIVLHEGNQDGPAVAGSWSWSADFRRLTFTPAAPLKAQTKYTIHMGMDMDAASGHQQHHTGTAGGHMGGTGAGMMGGSGSMMGGTHGAMSECLMLSTFTTA
jgi:hypothetical protein